MKISAGGNKAKVKRSKAAFRKPGILARADQRKAELAANVQALKDAHARRSGAQ